MDDSHSDRLSRQAWLDAGITRLATHGPQGLRIMAIAGQLGVTKGSFYWHFRDQAEYHGALLAAWEQAGTQQIIDQVEHAGGSARAKLRRLMGITVAVSPRVALAIRAWSATDVQAAKAVKRVDERRLAYLSGLIEGLGWQPDEAVTLARWSHGALLGYFMLEGPVLNDAQVDLILSTVDRDKRRPRTAG